MLDFISGPPPCVLLLYIRTCLLPSNPRALSLSALLLIALCCVALSVVPSRGVQDLAEAGLYSRAPRCTETKVLPPHPLRRLTLSIFAAAVVGSKVRISPLPSPTFRTGVPSRGPASCYQGIQSSGGIGPAAVAPVVSGACVLFVLCLFCFYLCARVSVCL